MRTFLPVQSPPSLYTRTHTSTQYNQHTLSLSRSLYITAELNRHTAPSELLKIQQEREKELLKIQQHIEDLLKIQQHIEDFLKIQ